MLRVLLAMLQAEAGSITLAAKKTNKRRNNMSVRRIYVEKRPDYAVRADELTNEFRAYLSLKDVTVRELVRYDVENLPSLTSPAIVFGSLRSLFSGLLSSSSLHFFTLYGLTVTS